MTAAQHSTGGELRQFLYEGLRRRQGAVVSGADWLIPVRKRGAAAVEQTLPGKLQQVHAVVLLRNSSMFASRLKCLPSVGSWLTKTRVAPVSPSRSNSRSTRVVIDGS